MYAEDSFFTLTPLAQVGLAALSLSLAGLSVLFVRWLRRGRWIGLLASISVFWVFLWLSPQVYYTYYRAVIPGLPAQLVIRAPPGPGQVLRLMTFQDRVTLSEHSKGVLGWALIAAGLWRQRS